MSGAVAALPEMLGRLKLTAMRDRLDSLLDITSEAELCESRAMGIYPTMRQGMQCRRSGARHPLGK